MHCLFTIQRQLAISLSISLLYSFNNIRLYLYLLNFTAFDDWSSLADRRNILRISSRLLATGSTTGLTWSVLAAHKLPSKKKSTENTSPQRQTTLVRCSRTDDVMSLMLIAASGRESFLAGWGVLLLLLPCPPKAVKGQTTRDKLWIARR